MESRKATLRIGLFSLLSIAATMIGGAFSPELFVLIPIFTLILIGLGCVTVTLVPVPTEVEVVVISEPVRGHLYNTRSKDFDPGSLTNTVD